MTRETLRSSNRNDSLASPWHRESYERFLNDYLPALLAARLPLESYDVAAAGPYTYRITVRLTGEGTAITYDLPRSDADGVLFVSPQERRLVLPIASSEDLEAAEIACVGEQLREEIDALLQGASLVQRLPLDAWVLDFVTREGQALDTTNPLATVSHRRRFRIDGPVEGFHPSQIGRADPIETPEGPNHGRFLHVARGAAIRDGRLIVVDDTPEARLGAISALIPFLAHSEPARTLMGANMMRQWHPLPAAESPLVQTGEEPAPVPLGFWSGVNLLTAYLPWGIDTHEDAVLVSETAARKLGFPYPLEPGDKLSNRHGTKGVVSRVVPDAEMPHLADGTPVEIIYSLMGLASRMNHGQLLEAAAGRIARAEGRPFVASPFGSPGVEEMQSRLQAAGLPRSGMERLTAGAGGAPLERTSTVGYVYWGRTHHDARGKVGVFGSGASSTDATPSGRAPGQRLGATEYQLLRDQGAVHCLQALFVTQATRSPETRLNRLQDRLGALGVQITRNADALEFQFTQEGEASGGATLPVPVPHPWRRARMLSALYAVAEPTEELATAFPAVREAADRVARMRRNDAPPRLAAEGITALRARIRAYADALLGPELFSPEVRVLASGRAVIAPGADLTIDQVGLPEVIARGLFGAEAGIEERMARSWVLLNRQPSLYPTSIVAFRPVLLPGESVIRLHPLLCNWFEADFDGDQMAVFLPLGEAAQQEAGELLSVRGRLKRDLSLLTEPQGQSRFPFAGLLPTHSSLYGLAELACTAEGRARIAEALGTDPAPAMSGGVFNRLGMNALLQGLLQKRGADAILEIVQNLSRLGFEAAKVSGASMGPFIGAGMELPPTPDEEAADAWEAWGDEVTETLAAAARAEAFADDELGALLLTVASGARGRSAFIAKVIASVSPGAQADPWGKQVPMRHGWRDGLTAEEYFTVVASNRRALRRMHDLHTREEAAAMTGDFVARGNGVLARAMRARRPGIVFAQAAANGEQEPLTDPDSRLFAGLPVN